MSRCVFKSTYSRELLQSRTGVAYWFSPLHRGLKVPGSIPIYECDFFADFVRNEMKIIVPVFENKTHNETYFDEWDSRQLTLILTYFTKLTYLASLRYGETWTWQLTYVEFNLLSLKFNLLSLLKILGHLAMATNLRRCSLTYTP